jgi:hypothetical protein
MLKTDTQPNREKLMRIALAQGSLFTADQAIQCGFDQKNHHYYVKTDQWEKVLRGIYRFKPIESDLSEYWLWYLWSKGRNKKPQAVFSHETALMLYEEYFSFFADNCILIQLPTANFSLNILVMSPILIMNF